MKLYILAFMALFSFMLNAFANEAKIFMTLSPAGSFEAICDRVKVKVKRSNGKIKFNRASVRVKSCKTGVELRDEHFKKHLKVSTVKMTDIEVGQGVGTGLLAIGKVKRKVSFKFTKNGDQINASFEVRPSNFNLPKAKYLGVGVQDLVKVQVKFKI